MSCIVYQRFHLPSHYLPSLQHLQLLDHCLTTPAAAAAAPKRHPCTLEEQEHQGKEIRISTDPYCFKATLPMLPAGHNCCGLSAHDKWRHHHTNTPHSTHSAGLSCGTVLLHGMLRHLPMLLPTRGSLLHSIYKHTRSTKLVS
jgi:hypothetical protein